jgi:type I restriction enzyme S subunit
MAAFVRKALGQLLLHPPRYGINAAAVPLRPGVATYIRITDINDAGKFAPDPKVGVAHKGAANYQLAPGELVFARTGASVGKSYLYNTRDGDIVYAGFLINIAPDPKRLNPKYLSLFVQTKEYWDWIARNSIRSGQPGVNGHEYATLPVPLPDIGVQDAIAAIMTDVDDLITALERTIAKQQAVKQGMMQQLLTGRTRLPGFTDSWSARSLGELVKLTSGQSPSGFRFGSVGKPYFKVDQLGKSSKYLNRNMTPYLSNGISEVPTGSILIAKRGAAIAHNRVRILTEPGFMDTNVMALTPSDPLDGEFLYYWLSYRGLWDVADVTSVPQINNKHINPLEIDLPEPSEQRAIVNALTDADDEITVLRARLDKVRAVKQGMMQQLLTGRTRLPVQEAAA